MWLAFDSIMSSIGEAGFSPPSMTYMVHLFLLVQASEITHYMIAVSEDVAPLKPVSTHLCTATSDLIPEVRKA